ncbi:hypothetical protein [Undibacterium terreum]|uniref:Uncharacterized protein n=1 Tax=Undibacterium terreum TaxID=1224302 RepID=A0A916XJV8_9BURK|nr:hypothetical protein [Undibacterium terreum]GGC76629.1 hypothetical protein GCM10011396_24820 [Undibacterium terreum]
MKHFFNLRHLKKIIKPVILYPVLSSGARRWAGLIVAGSIAIAPAGSVAQASLPVSSASTAPASASTPATDAAAKGDPKASGKTDTKANIKPAADEKAGAAQSKPAKPASGTYTTVGYNRNIRREDFAGLSKSLVLQLQKQLEAIYKNLPDWKLDYALKEQPLNDGIVGPITLLWLQRYGYNFKITTESGYAKGLPGNLDRIAAFGAAHPPELGILLSKEFENWDDALPDQVKNQDFLIRRQGNEQELLDLVNRFRASRKTAPRASAVKTDAGAYFIYTLKQADLDLLGGKDRVFAILSTLKDKEFNSLEAMKVALLQALGARDYLLNSLWPVVEKNASDFNGFLINEAALNKLKKEGTVAATVLDELRSFGTVYLKSREAFDTFIADKIAAGTLSITPEDTAIPVIADATQVFDNYHLDAQTLDTIKVELKGNVQNAGVPTAVVHMLEQIKDVEYPEISIFRSAAISKIAFGLDMCRLNSPSNNPYVAALRVSDDDVGLFKQELAALRPDPVDGGKQVDTGIDDLFAQITALRAKAEICDDATNAKGKDIVQKIYRTYLGVAIENAARKKMPDDIAPIKIKGSKCGCALDDLPGVVYGFYPYWNNQKTVQAINFRMLNRMAYYGLSVDNVGDFRLGGNSFDITDGSDSENEFMRVADQYNSKVDWMIQKNDWDGEWKTYSAQNKKAVFKKMLSNIMQLLRTPLTDAASKIKPYASFGLAKRPRRGDGVTLYFPNYPDDTDSTVLFNEFYLLLRTELDKHNLWLNILVSQNVLSAGINGGPGAFGFSNLVSLRKKKAATELRKPAGSPDNDEFILVLLNEPSSDAKKKLRQDIENDATMHGFQRADFFRSILPVLHFDNRNWQQLEDDIIYVRDNFGGVGFWAPNFDNLAQPVTDTSLSCLQSKMIAVCLQKNYGNQSTGVNLPNPLESFACVNRWALQLILTFLVLVALGLAVFFFRSCNVQNFIKKYFLWVHAFIVIPTVVIFILLLVYDPFFVNLSQGHLPLIIAAAIIVLGTLFGYRYLRARRKVPLRQRSLPQRQGLGFPIVTWSIENNKQGFQWIIKNRGSGYAIIKKIEILLDHQPVADVKTALESVMESNDNVLWKGAPLVGQKLQPGESLVALTIIDAAAAKAFEKKLNAHQLEVNIVYSAASNEHWVSNGKEITSISEV